MAKKEEREMNWPIKIVKLCHTLNTFRMQLQIVLFRPVLYIKHMCDHYAKHVSCCPCWPARWGCPGTCAWAPRSASAGAAPT